VQAVQGGARRGRVGPGLEVEGDDPGVVEQDVDAAEAADRLRDDRSRSP